MLLLLSAQEIIDTVARNCLKLALKIIDFTQINTVFL